MTEAAAVKLDAVVKTFGEFTAVHAMDLSIPEGSFLTLLGPSGCGKTTTLRMVAGLLAPSEGTISIRGRDVTGTPIHKRNLGLVFQNYALFPHRTIRENVAFGLRYRGVRGKEARSRVEEALDLVQLPHVADRYPRQLSGGQQQRIALARAIVIEPDVLLLDEPLSALDANLREDMRVELKNIQHRLGITTIFVTHDQSEALAMSDRIVVMNAGHVEQVGTPQEVYGKPSTLFVAQFLGNSNVIDARVTEAGADGTTVEAAGLGRVVVDAARAGGFGQGDAAALVVRAEKLVLGGEEGENSFPARVETVDYQGQTARYFLRAGDLRLQAINGIDEAPHEEGAEVNVALRARDCVLLAPEDAAR